MKKLTSILLSLVLVFSFAACSNNSSDNSNTTPSTSQTADASKSTDENTQNSNTSSKIDKNFSSGFGGLPCCSLRNGYHGLLHRPQHSDECHHDRRR